MRTDEYYPDNQLVYTMDGEGSPDCFAPSEPWTDDTTPRTDKPVRFFPRRSFPETGWRSHVWTPRDAESAERHAAMLA